ncbi:MAG: hypothetical protein HY393_00085 [Candidatus Diapherotrites archaeon]|nr:hypothetical protein [Candidatus Diapherotrites archaeon]
MNGMNTQGFMAPATLLFVGLLVLVPASAGQTAEQAFHQTQYTLISLEKSNLERTLLETNFDHSIENALTQGLLLHENQPALEKRVLKTMLEWNSNAIQNPQVKAIELMPANTHNYWKHAGKPGKKGKPFTKENLQGTFNVIVLPLNKLSTQAVYTFHGGVFHEHVIFAHLQAGNVGHAMLVPQGFQVCRRLIGALVVPCTP